MRGEASETPRDRRPATPRSARSRRGSGPCPVRGGAEIRRCQARAASGVQPGELGARALRGGAGPLSTPSFEGQAGAVQRRRRDDPPLDPVNFDGGVASSPRKRTDPTKTPEADRVAIGPPAAALGPAVGVPAGGTEAHSDAAEIAEVAWMAVGLTFRARSRCSMPHCDSGGAWLGGADERGYVAAADGDPVAVGRRGGR